MPAVEKQVRAFISSTFRDMHVERGHLVSVVFPELRERVEQLGLESSHGGNRGSNPLSATTDFTVLNPLY